MNLLHSAAAAPYQECFGCEMYPSLTAKAAYLFVHLASAHVFENGNKRTAAICLDVFFLVNSYYLFLSNEEVHDLAQEAASFGEQGKKFPEVLESTKDLIEKNIVPLSFFRTRLSSFYRAQLKRKRTFLQMRVFPFDAPTYQANPYSQEILG